LQNILASGNYVWMSSKKIQLKRVDLKDCVKYFKEIIWFWIV